MVQSSAYPSFRIWDGLNLNRLLSQPIKKLASGSGRPPVEAESELVQIVRQVFRAKGALQRPHDPSFEETCNTVAPWQHVLTDAIVGTDGLVPISHLLKPGVSRPSVGYDRRTGLRHSSDRVAEGNAGNIRNMRKPDPSNALPIAFGGDQNQVFPFGSAASLSVLFPAEIGFINLNESAQFVAAGPNHCPSQFVQAHPGRPVAAKSKGTLQP